VGLLVWPGHVDGGGMWKDEGRRTKAEGFRSRDEGAAFLALQPLDLAFVLH